MKLLFICTHNRCRSIIAEAVANDAGAGLINAKSAGSSPQSEVHPLSLYYLSKSNISTEGLKSQSWHEFETLAPDAVLTLCDSAAAETCPAWFDGTVKVHWGLKDPSAGEGSPTEKESQFMSTIDVLQRRIAVLLENDNINFRGAALSRKLNDIGETIF